MFQISHCVKGLNYSLKCSYEYLGIQKWRINEHFPHITISILLRKVGMKFDGKNACVLFQDLKELGTPRITERMLKGISKISHLRKDDFNVLACLREVVEQKHYN